MTEHDDLYDLTTLDDLKDYLKDNPSRRSDAVQLLEQQLADQQKEIDKKGPTAWMTELWTEDSPNIIQEQVLDVMYNAALKFMSTDVKTLV